MTDITDKSCRTMIEELAAKKPTPGGGAAAAMTAAMGMALANMVAEYTVGKAGSAELETELQELLSQGKELQAKLTDLMQTDIDGFEQLQAVQKGPREADGNTPWVEKLSDACKAACRPPIDVTKLGLKGLRICKRLAEIGNPYVITDVACAAALLQAALKASHQNILINMKNVIDFDFVDVYRHFSLHSVGEGDLIVKVVESKINQRA